MIRSFPSFTSAPSMTPRRCSPTWSPVWATEGADGRLRGLSFSQSIVPGGGKVKTVRNTISVSTLGPSVRSVAAWRFGDSATRWIDIRSRRTWKTWIKFGIALPAFDVLLLCMLRGISDGKAAVLKPPSISKQGNRAGLLRISLGRGLNKWIKIDSIAVQVPG